MTSRKTAELKFLHTRINSPSDFSSLAFVFGWTDAGRGCSCLVPSDVFNRDAALVVGNLRDLTAAAPFEAAFDADEPILPREGGWRIRSLLRLHYNIPFC